MAGFHIGPMLHTEVRGERQQQLQSAVTATLLLTHLPSFMPSKLSEMQEKF